MSIQQLFWEYAKVNIELENIFHISMPPNSKSQDKTTMPGVCGLIVPISGQARFCVDGKEYFLEKGHILHAGSKMPLEKEVIGTKDWEFILLHYRIIGNEKEQEVLMNSHYSVNIFADQNIELVHVLEQIIALQSKVEAKNDFAVGKESFELKILLYEVIQKILTATEAHHKETQRIEVIDVMEEAVSYIHENINQSMNINQLADIYHVTTRQFSYMFQKKMGITPKKYIMTLQISRAKELLKEELPVNEIANRSGFEDCFHFSKVFKRVVGVSPSEYRRQC